MRGIITVTLVVLGVLLVAVGFLAGANAPEPVLDVETSVERFGRAAGPWLTPGAILIVGGLVLAALDDRDED